MVSLLIGSWLLLWITVANGQLRPPKITEHPSDMLVRKLEPATLNCKAEGNPKPEIEWYHDGYLVEDSADRMIFSTGSLFFLKVVQNKREHDTGVYWCEAFNEVGRARSRNASLEVAFLREDFRLHPKNVKAAMGDVATLECIPPKGYPEPTMKWKKDKEVLNTNKGRLRIVAPGNLVISDVRQSDGGQYSCIAENVAGNRESNSATMTVHGESGPPGRLVFMGLEQATETLRSRDAKRWEFTQTNQPPPTLTLNIFLTNCQNIPKFGRFAY